MRAYVTYFDQRYVARAHVMLRSLRRHDPAAEIFVFCFDRHARELTAELGDTKLFLLSPQDLYAFDPSLAKCNDRKTNAFRATHKAAIAWYVLNQRRDLSSVAHIDADTYFFSSPEPLFAEIGSASVALSPHRYVFNQQRTEWFGRFNAGFIYWRSDRVGVRCLTDYRADCIAWCEPQSMPDGRFMNQGYLSKWPQRYHGVHVIEHPGVNLAPWNVAGVRIGEGREILIDGRPLVFFHFSSLIRGPDGVWRSGYTEFGDNIEIVRRAIYAPYLAEVERAEREIARARPGLLAAEPVWDWTESTVLRDPRSRPRWATRLFAWNGAC
jgi:hypothetical protein